MGKSGGNDLDVTPSTQHKPERSDGEDSKSCNDRLIAESAGDSYRNIPADIVQIHRSGSEAIPVAEVFASSDLGEIHQSPIE